MQMCRVLAARQLPELVFGCSILTPSHDTTTNTAVACRRLPMCWLLALDYIPLTNSYTETA
jgi:hypothetical protein